MRRGFIRQCSHVGAPKRLASDRPPCRPVQPLTLRACPPGGAGPDDLQQEQAHHQGGQAALAEHRVRSEEHTSELQSLMRISYAVFCLKKKITTYHLIRHT